MSPIIYGDIWTFYTPGTWLVLPTNVGFKKDGSNPMGAGLAEQVVKRWPDLPLWYGGLCRQMRERTPVLFHPDHHVICFPTKPFNTKEPHASWKAAADPALIAQGFLELLNISRSLEADARILLPPVGCGKGGLPIEAVLPMMLLAQQEDPRILPVIPLVADEVISEFRGSHSFLSNFHTSPVMYEGVLHKTNEHAFQAAKAIDPAHRDWIRSSNSAGDAKARGRAVKCRPDWDEIQTATGEPFKVGVMRALTLDKYTRGTWSKHTGLTPLGTKLVDTYPCFLIEGNQWKDQVWGVCQGAGENWLGRILMEVRAVLRQRRLATEAKRRLDV